MIEGQHTDVPSAAPVASQLLGDARGHAQSHGQSPRQSPALSRFEHFAEQYLNFERTPAKDSLWLEGMRWLCERLGNPQEGIPCVHVAGSKGKGSTAAMIACALKEAGYTVGLYTSPHVSHFAERIGEPTGPFAESVYERSVERLIQLVQASEGSYPRGRRPTWFELATALCFLCFKEARVDFAVYEVGLGGRLDSTNVVHPRCTCVTRIEKEHTQWLGDTLEQIAREKAGIFKRGVPAVVFSPDEPLKAVFRNVAQEKGCPLVFADEMMSSSTPVHKIIRTPATGAVRAVKTQLTLSISCLEHPLELSLSLAGSFQSHNAAVAAIALKTILPSIDEGTIELGLSAACLSARFELIDLEHTPWHGCTLILDVSHTPSSVACTMQTLDAAFPTADFPHRVLLFACASDKDVGSIAPLFKDKFSCVFLTTPGQSLRADLDKTRRAFDHAAISYTATGECRSAAKAALDEAASCEGLVLAVGSFYLACELKAMLSE